MHKLSFSIRDLLCSLNVLVLLVLGIVMAGCGPGESAPLIGPATCGPDQGQLPGGGCAGLPSDMLCPPGQTPIEGGARNGGSCQPAGVPPNGCGEGFEHDDNGGCEPILPPDLCPPGQMAVPGQTQCREVAPCGTDDYGLIPVDADTEYVNAAYDGANGISDGAQARPWKTIQEGIDNAKSGAIVAIAEGNYQENLWVHHRPVRLWGRCPARVKVVGIEPYATLEISSKPTSHSEVRNLAITGSGTGILVTESSEVVIDHVWVHDTGGRGIGVQDTFGSASVAIKSSLIEAASEVGIFLGGVDATIEATVVRATQSRSDGTAGVGIAVQDAKSTHKPATLTLSSSLLEQNHEFGIFVQSSNAVIEATVVRTTQPRSDDTLGCGVAAQTTHARATLMLRTSLVEQNHESGVHAEGSDITIEATVVRNTRPSSDGNWGRGIAVMDEPVENDPAASERSTLRLRTSLVEKNHEVGVLVEGSDATIEAIIVRGIEPRGDGRGGSGIAIQYNPTTHQRSSLTLQSSLLEQNHEIGIGVTGSDAMIEATVVRGTHSNRHGTFGDGIGFQDVLTTHERSTGTVHASIVEQNHRAGIFVIDSEATIEATVVRGTLPQSNQSYGDGIALLSYAPDGFQPASRIVLTMVEDNARAGIASFGGAVVLVSSNVQCNRFDINGEEFSPGGLSSRPFTFDGSKGNLCGCGKKPDPSCTAESVGLSPPPRMSEVEP